MTKCLLDSDILIGLLRGKLEIDIFKEVISDSQLFISVITFAELLRGAKLSRDTKKELEKVNEMIRDMGITILPITSEVAFCFSEIQFELEKLGKKLDEFDLLIAATAIVDECDLFTMNIKHFGRVKGLILRNK